MSCRNGHHPLRDLNAGFVYLKFVRNLFISCAGKCSDLGCLKNTVKSLIPLVYSLCSKRNTRTFREQYIQAPSSRAELCLGVPFALPGWRELWRFRQPELWGSLTSHCQKPADLSELSWWDPSQSPTTWALTRPAWRTAKGLRGRESYLLSISAWLKLVHLSGVF